MRTVSKVYLLVLFFIALYSCSNLDDINTRLEQVESEVNKEQKPRLLSFGFLTKDNAQQLIENVKGTIDGDSLVVCWILTC